MKIEILCDSKNHPINNMLEQWRSQNQSLHDVRIVREADDLGAGELLLLISCNKIISSEVRARFEKTLLIHASDLPLGRGWSPHIWELLDGATTITLSLLEAEDKVDSGKIWKKTKIVIPRTALYNEINQLIFSGESDLMDFAVQNFYSVIPEIQNQLLEPTYYRRRTPADSEINPNDTIADQFNLLRLSDPNRYPAFFNIGGRRYKLVIESFEDE